MANESKTAGGELDLNTTPATVTGRDGVTHTFRNGHDAIEFACRRLAEEIMRRRETDAARARTEEGR